MCYADGSQGQMVLWWLNHMVNAMSKIKLFKILPLRKSYHLLHASLYVEHFICMAFLQLHNDER